MKHLAFRYKTFRFSEPGPWPGHLKFFERLTHFMIF